MQLKQLTDEFFVCGQLGPDDVRHLAAEGIRTIINNRPDDEEPGQPSNADLHAAATACGVGFHHLPFASGVVPEPIADTARGHFPGMDKPVLAFCRSGMRAEIMWNQVLNDEDR